MDGARQLAPPTAGCHDCGQCKVGVLVLLVFIVNLIACQSSIPGPPAGVLTSEPAPAATFLYPIGLPTATARSRVFPSTAPFTPFQWKPVSSATGYYLQVGTAPGLQDVFAVGELPPNITSWTVDNLLPGLYYTRLYTHSAAGWGYRDLVFYTLAQPIPFDQSTLYATVGQLTASVRLSADASTNEAVPGSPLAAELAERNRTRADCTDYSYTLSGLLQQQHIYSRIVVITLNQTVGHTIVEYYDPFWNKWSVADATFGVVYFDDGLQRGQSAAELNQYVDSESWDLIKPKFVTPNGDSYMTNYYMDPITLYLNLVPQGSTEADSVIHDPRQFLLLFSPNSANPHGYYLFEFGAINESLELNNPPGPFTPSSGVISVPAEDSTMWSAPYTLNDGWSVVSASSDSEAYTFRRVMF